MSIKLSDSIRVGQQKPLEDKYFNELVPYTSTTQVNTLLLKSIRHIGLTVNINGEEYWYKDGIEDENLVLKITNIDTSNLVPYNGATQDVNIGAHYIESAIGFKLTDGESNQFLMADGSTSTLPTDLIKGTGTTNYIPKFSATGTLINSIIRDESSRIVVNGGALFQTNADIVIRSISGDNPGDFVFQNTSSQEQGRIYSTNDALIFSAGINPSPKMVVRSNGIGINIPTLNPSEWLEVGGYAKATGFKTPTGTATQALIANGGTFDLNTKADLVGGKVPSSQLPSYVDDVLEFANLASFPATGESGKIYIAIDTNLTYRWGGSSYVVMSSSLALGETSSTAYRGDRGKIAYDHSQVTGNPHNTTKSDIGLGNVPNIDATNPTNIVQTSSYRFVTDSEKTNLSAAYNHSQTTGNVHNTKIEELSDVSGDATTIIDTDVILKKESGGLWKKITFANFKNWFTTELAKKINIGLDTVFNFKNISAMTLNEFRSITPNIETIYFTEEQNASGWQQVRYNSNYSIGYQELIETAITINSEELVELDSDSTFNLIDVATTKINGIFEKDFVIITFNAKVETPSTPNQWFKIIMRINGVQAAVSPVFYLLEPAGIPERISHSFALNVPAEMVTHGATLHIKPSVNLVFNSLSITVARVHKSTISNI